MTKWSAEKARLYMRKKREERRKLGLCVTCGSRPAANGHTTCKVCIANSVNAHRLKWLASHPIQTVDGLLNEVWKPIVGYKGYYEISNQGRVKSLARVNSRGSKIGTALLSANEAKKYLYVTLFKNCKSRHYRIHRLVALAFIPNPLSLPMVNHKDGNTLNNSVDNLEWVTDAQNKLHASLHGLIGGDKARTAKLTIQQVKEIRRSYPHISGYKLAKIYGLHGTTICRIIKRTSWKYI